MAGSAVKSVTYCVAQVAGGYAVLRKDDPVKTPAGAALVLPKQPLADVIAGELQAQGTKPNLTTMHFTQLAMTAVDIVGKEREKITAQTAGFAESELLCHRAEDDDVLLQEQQKIWQPLLDWCAQKYKAPLTVGAGIMPIRQKPENIAALRNVVASFDNYWLAGLAQAASVTGSLVLALALAEKHLNATQVFAAAELDALHQMKKWGEDPAVIARNAAIRHDLDICEKWFGLLG